MVAAQSLLLSLMVYLLVENAVSFTFTSRLIHRFSEEAKALRISRSENWSSVERSWPERRSMEYYQILLSSDFQRQKMKLGSQYQLLFPSEGSKTMSFGNDFGWCSLVFGASIMQDRDLNEYSPTSSSTSKHIPCSHHVCDSKPSCKNSKQPCAYQIDYNTENTSSSGLLVEDILHLSSGGHKDASNSSVQASVVIGCGMKQSGGYLDGVAPDGLMGLGLGEISVPSFLAKAGLVQDSFSVCFDDNYSGRIFFGDQGAVTQQSTPFLLLDGK